MSDTNFIAPKPAVTDADRKALEKAKKLESKQVKKGYRWYMVNNRSKVLVECDEHGTPTAKGMRVIEAHKKSLM